MAQNKSELAVYHQMGVFFVGPQNGGFPFVSPFNPPQKVGTDPESKVSIKWALGCFWQAIRIRLLQPL